MLVVQGEVHPSKLKVVQGGGSEEGMVVKVVVFKRVTIKVGVVKRVLVEVGVVVKRVLVMVGVV
eukprot:557098-Ditylum_brightwellii.AAC.1